MLGMKQAITGWDPPTYCEPWPAARLLLIVVFFLLWGRSRFGWSAASIPSVGKTAEEMLGVFLFLGLISRTLGALYLALVAFPLFATKVLNEWIYRACYWTFRTFLRLLYLRRISALVAMLAEIGLFLALWELILLLLRRFCL